MPSDVGSYTYLFQLSDDNEVALRDYKYLFAPLVASVGVCSYLRHEVSICHVDVVNLTIPSIANCAINCFDWMRYYSTSAQYIETALRRQVVHCKTILFCRLIGPQARLIVTKPQSRPLDTQIHEALLFFGVSCELKSLGPIFNRFDLVHELWHCEVFYDPLGLG